MTPYLINVLGAAQELIDSIERQVEFVSANSLFIQRLLNEQILQQVEITLDGIVFTQLSARKVALAMNDHFGWLFTRERAGTLYNWVTTSTEFNCQIILEANENIDVTGTLVTFPSTTPQP